MTCLLATRRSVRKLTGCDVFGGDAVLVTITIGNSMHGPTNASLTHEIIGLAMHVHSRLGPGLLESAYERCLCHEFDRVGLAYIRQVALPLDYDGVHLECGYRVDLIARDEVILELKAVEKIQPLHEAQLLTYLRLSRYRVGLLINFNTVSLKDGIRRRVL
jgi:GxxExxY protein